tara:strand:- start:554 stop:1708 length:1155 start_codon:yes stop_codon:yes gene_type:complete
LFERIRKLGKRWWGAGDGASFGPGWTYSQPVDLVVGTTEAERMPAIYRALDLISGDLAKVDKRAEMADGTPLEGGVVRLLTRRPCDWLNAFEFWRLVSYQLLRDGNSVSVLNYNAAGVVESIEPVLMNQAAVSVAEGRVLYMIRGKAYEPEDVLHFRTRSLDGIWGKSPLQICNPAAALMVTQETSAKRIAQSLAAPTVVINHPGTLTDGAVANIKSAYLREHSKPTNVPLVLREGMKAESLSMQASDAEFQKARAYSIDDVARIYGLPSSSMLGSFADTRYSSDLGSLNKAYADQCLSLWAAPMAAEVANKLGFDRFVFDFTHVQKGTFAAQVDALVKATAGGIISRDEARARLGYPPGGISSSSPDLDEESVEIGGEEEAAA